MSGPGQDVAAQTELLADRLRHLALTRLLAPYEPESTRVQAARALTQRLADAAAALEQPGEPYWRVVPDVGAESAGDLLAVCAHDVLCAAAVRDDLDVLPTRAGESVTVAALLTALASAARELRRRL